MAGQKRTRDGQVKPTDATTQAAIEPPITDPTPPCAQPQLPCSKSSSAQTPTQDTPPTKHPKPTNAAAPTHPKPAPSKPTPTNPNHQKLPRLPPNTKISKRPLLHPSPAPPFSSALSPKTIYITPSTPLIPALKRIRALLAQISRRENASLHAAEYGRKMRRAGALRNTHVERDLAAGGSVGGSSRKEGGEGEKVFLKASGRAIGRALEVGVEMQGEGCGVRVEMGSVRAVDDVEVVVAGVEGGDEDVPETRLRNVSCVTVSIWVK